MGANSRLLVALIVLCGVSVIVLNFSHLSRIVRLAGHTNDYRGGHRTWDLDSHMSHGYLTGDLPPPITMKNNNNIDSQGTKLDWKKIQQVQQERRRQMGQNLHTKSDMLDSNTLEHLLANKRGTVSTADADSKKQNTANNENNSDDDDHHRVAGLNCDSYGGPSNDLAKEMIYWNEIDESDYRSPFAALNSPEEPKYLTFEPDEGGWNNIRMSMETAVAMAVSMGRTLVMPPHQKIYLLNQETKAHDNIFNFDSFFHFDSIEHEHTAVEIISFEEFLTREALTGQLRNVTSGEVSFPPQNKTNWDGFRSRGNKLWKWMRSVSTTPKWFFDECVVGFPAQSGEGGGKRMMDYFSKTQDRVNRHQRIAEYTDNPTPVNESPEKRLRELLGNRRSICVYGEKMQQSKVIHLMGDNASGARLLVHFYMFLFFESWESDLWTKRFVRDHLRYIDQIQCAAARIVQAIRDKARENASRNGRSNPDGLFDTFHIRRGDFQYKTTRVEAIDIYNNTRDLLQPRSTIYIATDERNKSFFDPLREYYNLYFLDDFVHLIPNLNKNYYGMLDQLIASRGKIFIGTFFSTFTGYITRLRGYHSQKQRAQGYEMGVIDSYYYIPVDQKYAMRHYISARQPLWGREFPVAWRDIDHNVAPEQLLRF